MLMKKDMKTAVKIFVCIICALLSAFVISRYAASPQLHAGSIRTLDEKRTNVMELTAAVMVASTAVSALPDDTASPLADKLADISSSLMIVLCAIYLEKYLLTITGYFAFSFLIPAAFILKGFSLLSGNNWLKTTALKTGILGLVLFSIIPVSVRITNLIDETYQVSIDETLDNAKNSMDNIEAGAENLEENGGLTGFLTKAGNALSGVKEKAETMINNFIDAAAVMLITSCVIPILVFLAFVWAIRIIVGADIPVPDLKKLFGKKQKLIGED